MRWDPMIATTDRPLLVFFMARDVTINIHFQPFLQTLELTETKITMRLNWITICRLTNVDPRNKLFIF